MEKVFFKNIIVSESSENISELDKIINSGKPKRFLVELVADDCEDYIKDLIGSEVVLDFNGLKKITTEENKTYYVCHQHNVVYM